MKLQSYLKLHFVTHRVFKNYSSKGRPHTFFPKVFPFNNVLLRTSYCTLDKSCMPPFVKIDPPLQYQLSIFPFLCIKFNWLWSHRQSLSGVQGWSRALKMCTKDTINASAWATDMGYAIALKITDIIFPDLVQIHLFVFCQSGPPKPTRPLTLNKEKTGMA